MLLGTCCNPSGLLAAKLGEMERGIDIVSLSARAAARAGLRARDPCERRTPPSGFVAPPGFAAPLRQDRTEIELIWIEKRLEQGAHRPLGEHAARLLGGAGRCGEIWGNLGEI